MTTRIKSYINKLSITNKDYFDGLPFGDAFGAVGVILFYLEVNYE